jgi:hypothetical protein
VRGSFEVYLIFRESLQSLGRDHVCYSVAHGQTALGATAVHRCYVWWGRVVCTDFWLLNTSAHHGVASEQSDANRSLVLTGKNASSRTLH